MLVQLILANVFFSIDAVAGGDVNLPEKLDISLGFETTRIEDLPIPRDLEMRVVLLGDTYIKRATGCLNDEKWYSLTNNGASIVVGNIEWVQVIRDCTAPHLEAENCRFQCADAENCEYINLFYGQSSYNNVQFRTYRCTFVSGEQGVPGLVEPPYPQRSLSGPRACGPEGSMLKESPSQQSVNSGTAISCLTRGFLYKTVDSYGQSSLRKTVKWMQLQRGCTTEEDEVENCRIHCKKNGICRYINFWYEDQASKAPARRYYTCELLHGMYGVPELVDKTVHANDPTKMSGPRDCKNKG